MGFKYAAVPPIVPVLTDMASTVLRVTGNSGNVEDDDDGCNCSNGL